MFIVVNIVDTLTHLQAGAQKKMVFGPAGWSRMFLNLATKAMTS